MWSCSVQQKRSTTCAANASQLGTTRCLAKAWEAISHLMVHCRSNVRPWTHKSNHLVVSWCWWKTTWMHSRQSHKKFFQALTISVQPQLASKKLQDLPNCSWLWKDDWTCCSQQCFQHLRLCTAEEFTLLTNEEALIISKINHQLEGTILIGNNNQVQKSSQHDVLLFQHHFNTNCSLAIQNAAPSIIKQCLLQSQCTTVHHKQDAWRQFLWLPGCNLDSLKCTICDKEDPPQHRQHSENNCANNPEKLIAWHLTVGTKNSMGWLQICDKRCSRKPLISISGRHIGKKRCVWWRMDKVERWMRKTKKYMKKIFYLLWI